jgi:hypothetical protein
MIHRLRPPVSIGAPDDSAVDDRPIASPTRTFACNLHDRGGETRVNCKARLYRDAARASFDTARRCRGACFRCARVQHASDAWSASLILGGDFGSARSERGSLPRVLSGILERVRYL